MSKHVVAALSSALFTLAWWKAAALRGVRTSIVIALPYLGSAVVFHGVPWASIGSAALLGFLASVITSLAGIPEAAGKTVPFWVALLERSVKSLAQGLAVGIGNAVFFTDVHWSTVGQAALISTLGSLLLGVLGYLPEASDPNGPTVEAEASSIADVPAVAMISSAAPTPDDPEQPSAGAPPTAI